MEAARTLSMSVEEFLTWAEPRPERWELVDGVPVAMSPERVAHVRTKARLARAFEDGLREAGAGCEFLGDGIAVQIDPTTAFQPDGLVYCGERAAGELTLIPNPVIVVEVLSPSNALRDLRDKLLGYFRVPSICHYLIVDPDKPLVIHHSRGGGGEIITRLVSSGRIDLDPPGLSMAVDAFFEPPESPAT